MMLQQYYAPRLPLKQEIQQLTTYCGKCIIIRSNSSYSRGIPSLGIGSSFSWLAVMPSGVLYSSYMNMNVAPVYSACSRPLPPHTYASSCASLCILRMRYAVALVPAFGICTRGIIILSSIKPSPCPRLNIT